MMGIRLSPTPFGYLTLPGIRGGHQTPPEMGT